MYYALIVLSVTLFGGCFALNDLYRKQKGSSFKISLQFSLLGSLSGLLLLLCINGFRLEYTPFTLLMALLAALNGFAFTLCSFKALDHINLSLYSLFSMLGGMLLPFLQGILFYGESITLAKTLCLLLLAASLLLTLQPGNKKSGTIFYLCVFFFNGMSGVLSKIFAEAPFPKTDAVGYTNWISLCTIVIAALLLPFFRGEKSGKPSFSGICIGAASGIANRVANLLLVVALAHVDASVQYPMVTGGVIIVSTLICFFGANKPSKKEILSVVLAFIGLFMIILPSS